MSLFQNAVLNKYLKGIDDKKASEAWEIFANHFHNPEVQENIRNSKEEEYQEGFLEDLFVKVLGYTKYPTPNFNLRVEQKDEVGAKKADGALLDGDKVKAVIELKGTDTTDLGKVEAQAFGYKNKQSDAEYVIISNFEKLRFYIDNAVDFMEFNLFLLDEEEFKVLWLCLSHDSFTKNLPKRLKDESLSEEESITKTLYKDYSAFKRDILDNIVVLNPEYDKLLLFRKTQKLLDRFLFVFFAEDRSLLPPNSIRQVITQWMDLRDKYDEYVPLYERFKKYFGYMNEGHKGKKHDIFAYNGGLFAPDEVLDTIKIDDDVLYKHSLQLSNYDFESDVDVNILGHIFEHSLNEIEEITAEIKGEVVDTSKTKRKKDGVFYTPKYITKYIVENTVGKLCDEKKIELNIIDERFIEAGRRTKKGVDDLKAYRAWLLSLTICDPACGSGAFLNQALEFLIAEHKYLDELTAKYHNSPMVLSDIENSILENNLYGVDINDEAVEIAKLSLWLRTAQRGRKLTTLNNRIKCGNSLIDDPKVAGDKAFNWEAEFPEIFPQKYKQAFHVTWVTHNARTSQRMIEYQVKKGESIWLVEELEMVVAKALASIISEDELNVMNFNICGDHVHMLLVCDPEELPNIVRKLKGKSAQITKEYLKVPKEEAFHLWAQKFNRKPIEDEDGLANAFDYIQDNRIKHNLPVNKELQKIIHGKSGVPTFDKGLQPLASGACVSYEQAFRPEYSGGFDVVIGNPPYVQSHSLDKKTKDFIYSFYETAEYQINTYGIFIEKAIKILNDNSIYGLIIPNFWLSTKYDSKLRKKVFHTNNAVEVLNLFEVFEDATVDTCILTGKIDTGDTFPKKTKVRSISQKLKTIKSRLLAISTKDWEFDEETIFTKGDQEIKIFFHDTLELSGDNTLKKFFNFRKGMQPYEKGKGTPTQTREMMNEKVYHSELKVDDSFLPLLKARNVQRYLVKGTSGFIKYGSNLAAPRSKELFMGNRILLNRILSGERIDGVYVENELINNTDIFNLLPKNNEVNPKVFLPLIVSKLCATFFKLENVNLSRAAYPKINVNTLEKFPIPTLDVKTSEKLILFTDSMLILHSSLYTQVTNLSNLLLSKFDIDKLPRKLGNWHELSFKDFLKELKKKKVTLSLSEEAEWMGYFNQEKEKAQALQVQINQTDQEIDQMVYELYGLSEDEIEIVENSIK